MNMRKYSTPNQEMNFKIMIHITNEVHCKNYHVKNKRTHLKNLNENIFEESHQIKSTNIVSNYLLVPST